MINVVAEISANHQGSVDTAKRLIDACAWAGVSHVKGQKRDVWIDPPSDWDRPYNSEHAFAPTYLEHRRRLELPIEAHCELRDYALERGVTYFASAWDVHSTKELLSAGFGTIKVPSACLTDGELLSTMAAGCSDVHLSTGMGDMGDVAEAVATLGASVSVVYQCTSSYPCDNADVNLRVLHAYRRAWPELALGLSGHHRGIQVDAAAIALGATWLERHVTLDRTAKGSDHAASLEADGLRRLVRDVRAVTEALGDERKRVLDCELPVMAKLRTARMRGHVV